MGQGASTSKDTLTLGHLAGSPPQRRPLQPSESLLRSKPHWYGLYNDALVLSPASPASSSSSSTCCSSSSSSNSFAVASPLRIGSAAAANTAVTVATATCSIGRVDSGYAEQQRNKDERLVADLRYIDDTYYGGTTAPLRLPQTASHSTSSTTMMTVRESKLTLADITPSSKAVQDVCLSRKCLSSLSPNIGLLTMIRRLDISHNHLTTLPDAIGYLTQLEVLNVAHNRFTALPDTICHLSRLVELDASHNHLRSLTPYVAHLKQLQYLLLNKNHLKLLPVEIGAATALLTLDVSHNPLTCLPAEIVLLPYLCRIKVDNCALQQEEVAEYPLAHDPPRLREICARLVLRKQLSTQSLPGHLVDYIASAKACSSCQQPYMDSYAARYRFVERGDRWIPLEYRLCSAHWSDDNDRLLDMFSGKKPSDMTVTLPPIAPLADLPPLEGIDTRTAPRLPASCPTTLSSPDGSGIPTEADLAQHGFSGWWPSQRLKKVMHGQHGTFFAPFKRPHHHHQQQQQQQQQYPHQLQQQPLPYPQSS